MSKIFIYKKRAASTATLRPALYKKIPHPAAPIIRGKRVRKVRYIHYINRNSDCQ